MSTKVKTEPLSICYEEYIKFTEVDKVIAKMMARLAQFDGYTPPHDPNEFIHEIMFDKKPRPRVLKWYHQAKALYTIVTNEF
jgi:hypothetical protein